ncbi:hypothetical protein ND440_02360 [Yersinia ruckeri]|uniref:hypothetical protein n=1 Tax=Yersinia ruckeri TaxID=29486 RepID=UPI0020BE8676|nr:hypothetical protein [Yersinia ruckeri]MCW6541001.1 hypothetical protein [Yersinia ruckeri]MCW6638293.1 hypothetical protein [Yersinia ruckeri]UZX65690.1 hypothetical protein ND440_02360 [Yersinia ruckeri]UZY11890.1 hypothetical protein LNQ46_002335 [Yersinia ruckeri]
MSKWLLFMKCPNQLQKLKFIITVGALAGVAIHVIWPHLAIDAITLGLIVVALLPWLAPLVKSVELPGGLKVELQEIKEATERVKNAGLLETSASSEKMEHTFLQVAQQDPNLALAGFRIEIERRLVDLCERNGLSTRNRGLSSLLRGLSEKNILTVEQNSAIENLASLLNSATHGAQVDPAAAKWALNIAPDLLDSLSR